MRRILLRLLQVLFCADITSALDEGRFLWVQKNTDNFTSGEKNWIRPARWTRSIFNWLHSPLMNSIQESFVIDSVYENVEPEVNCKKRSITTKPDDSKIEENVENEFFLWEDNGGHPLEFGLKQVQDFKQSSHLSRGRIIGRSVWEEPMFYEDNWDANEIDTNHLSYHEQLKLSDMKQKMNSALKQIFTSGHTTKPHSKYYTMAPDFTTISVLASKNISNKDYSSKKNKYDSYLRPEINNYTNGEENWTSGISIENISNKYSASSLFRNYLGSYSNFDRINLPVVSNYRFENTSSHNEPCYDEKINTEINIKDSDEIFSHSLKPLVSYNRDISHSSEPLFNLLKSNPKGVELGNHFINEVKKNKRNQEETLKPRVTHKCFSKDAKNHRNLRTVLNRKFPKHGRKANRKLKKFKFSDGHSYQYELFTANLKSYH